MPVAPTTYCPPLEVIVYFHHDSSQSRDLANSLFLLLNGEPKSWSPRIPVTFITDPRQTAVGIGAERQLLVVLADGRMASEPERRGAWREFLADALDASRPAETVTVKTLVLPVAVDGGAYELDDDLAMVSFARLDLPTGEKGERTLGATQPLKSDQSWNTRLRSARRKLDLHVLLACRALLDEPSLPVRAIAGRPVDGMIDANALLPSKMTLFLSHAKLDIDWTHTWRGPLRALRVVGDAIRIDQWIDSNQIREGDQFDVALEKAVRSSHCLVVILTDNYSDREWCRRELSQAKRLHKPVVVIDAVRSSIVRLFPYIGNTPLVRWRSAVQDDPRLLRRSQSTELLEMEDANTVIRTVLYETVRYEYERSRLKPLLPGAAVFGTTPEAITVAHARDEEENKPSVIIYPDPPLSDPELIDLKIFGVRLVTPWTLDAGSRTRNVRIALSVSDAADVEICGGSRRHLDNVVADVTQYLLAHGYTMGYGGTLNYFRPEEEQPDRDARNLVVDLMDYVRRYRSTRSRDETKTRSEATVINWVAWPYDLNGSSHGSFYREWFDRDVVGTNPHPARNATPYQLATALSEMRQKSVTKTQARIAIGGALTGYQGLLPGVMEEVLLSIRAGQPVYLVGGFGGASRAVAELLLGRSREEFLPGGTAEGPTWERLNELYEAEGNHQERPSKQASGLMSRSGESLHLVLANGLGLSDNLRLMNATDPRLIVALVGKGLTATFVQADANR